MPAFRPSARRAYVVGAVAAVLGCGRTQLEPFGQAGPPGDAAAIYAGDHPGSDGSSPDGTLHGVDAVESVDSVEGVDRAVDRGSDGPVDGARSDGVDASMPPDPCGGACSGGARCVTGSFAGGQVLATGQTPNGLAAADFDGDGIPDLVVANRNSVQPDLFLGRGDGSFGPSKGFDAGGEQLALAVGDFDADGRPDLAFMDRNYLTTWKGTGGGVFQMAHQYPGGGFASWMTAADLDRDGALDLAVTQFNGGSVILFRGDGHGAFQAQSPIAVGDEPVFVAAADLDGDKNVDLVVVDPGSDDIDVLLGKGAGTFGAGHTLGLGFDPTCAAVADFDGDGILDVAVNDMGGINLLFGDGGGGFGAESHTSAEQGGVVWITTADVNADGIPDLVAGTVRSVIGTGNGFGDVLVGRGDGTFLRTQRFDSGSFPTSIVVTDLNRDGHPDLAVVDYLEDTLTIYLWNAGFHCE